MIYLPLNLNPKCQINVIYLYTQETKSRLLQNTKTIHLENTNRERFCCFRSVCILELSKISITLSKISIMGNWKVLFRKSLKDFSFKIVGDKRERHKTGYLILSNSLLYASLNPYHRSILHI